MTHKKFDKPNVKGYRVILVGAYKGHIFGDVYDDIGDNISYKNLNYCELTGIYWLWKNCNDDYIGLVHYRRFFSNHLSDKKIASEKDILKKLEKADIITPFTQILPISVKQQYCNESGFEKDLIKLEQILLKKYPSYVETYNEIINGNKLFFYNMMVVKKDIFDDYCRWLFDILFELEKEIDFDGYNDYQKRIYGFLAERLLNVYVKKNNLKIYQMGVIQPEENRRLTKKILMALKRTLLYKLW